MTASTQNRQGTATRTKLLKTAERLFAEQGVDAVSIRAINAAAGLGPASVNYHFGTKDDLLAAVLLDLGASVRDRIRENTAVLAESPQPPTAEELVRAVTEPYRELLGRQRTRGMRWIKIIAQLSSQRHPALDAAEKQVREELLIQVRRAFPQSDPMRLEPRWAVVLMGFLQAMSRADEWNPYRTPLPADELASFHEDQVSFLIGGIDRLLG